MLTTLERHLLERLQEGLPLEPRPFAALARELGLKENQVLEMLRSLKEKGILRHLGASPDSRRLGFVTTLAATAAPPERAEEVARKIAARPEVTHCYLRRHHMNIWFTLVARDFEEIENIIRDISSETGTTIKHFPARKLFKLRATFKLQK
ncbi:Lrp/AsnC family transcriptional regulator [Thermosulfurimonas sp. F29]|uniref:Lrp/AsnC family transcriptional regulator n=1 Tax=Thermosulfurimonas sp. F29 TaxID=2867247 RepID=UPI001C82ABFC|nr:Lrp/AsnC ligand binding domain-containing protein [Thermosulfurimonas sp. F29]MBX6422385.1 Lrp/AsnC ligand binding domain-containing protein [Thermosulfurimonas sp. F29]